MTRHVVLLRGVNVGPHRRVSMAAVREALTASPAASPPLPTGPAAPPAAFADVVTHLQSGNIVLDSDLAVTEVGPAVQRALADRLDLRTDVLVRSPDELAAAIDADPLGPVATDPSRHVLGFLASEPEPDRLAWIEDRIATLPSDGDRHAFVGRHLYLWCPNGISKSPYFTVPWDRLGVSSTQRNWNTVTALLRLARR